MPILYFFLSPLSALWFWIFQFSPRFFSFFVSLPRLVLGTLSRDSSTRRNIITGCRLWRLSVLASRSSLPRFATIDTQQRSQKKKEKKQEKSFSIETRSDPRCSLSMLRLNSRFPFSTFSRQSAIIIIITHSQQIAASRSSYSYTVDLERLRFARTLAWSRIPNTLCFVYRPGFSTLCLAVMTRVAQRFECHVRRSILQYVSL